MLSELDHPPWLDIEDARRIIGAALAEDIGSGDVTSSAVIPEDVRFDGVMRARHAMVIAGLPVAREVFRMVVPAAHFRALIADGDAVNAGTILGRDQRTGSRAVDGGTHGTKPVANSLSGSPPLTHQYVERIRGTGCTLTDTRKTIPGMRKLSKYATRCGGARNHRMGLFDAILIKDNHIAVCGSISEAVRKAKSCCADIERFIPTTHDRSRMRHTRTGGRGSRGWR